MARAGSKLNRPNVELVQTIPNQARNRSYWVERQL